MFSGEDGVDRLAEMAYYALEDEDRRVAEALYGSICEVGCNVPQHSGQNHGFMAAQTTWHGREINFAVGDSGVGIAETLAAVGVSDEAEAVELVLRQGLSSTGDPARGRGIPQTRELLTSVGGSLFVATGHTLRTAYTRDMTRRRADRPFRGTLLQGTIRRH